MARTRKGKETGKPTGAGATNSVSGSTKATPAKRAASAIIDEDEHLPRKRGQPPFGGETIKIIEDDKAAAEQLETELLDSAKKTTKKVTKKAAEKDTTNAHSGKKSKESRTAVSSAKKDSGTTETKPDSPGSSSGPKQFWLMKAEQEDRFETAKNGNINNTKFTIDDLKVKQEPEPWDGVRNPVAAKNLRSMRKGDLAFFYASGGKAGRKPGITGVMEVVSESEPDPSVHDEGSYGYVEKASDRDKWVIVKVVFRHKLETPLPLKDLQKHQDGSLAGMQLFKQTRLSVSKVEQAEWNFILKELIQEEALRSYLT